MLFKKEWKKLVDILKCSPWNNIVSRKEDVELTSEQRNIAKKSRRFRKDRITKSISEK